MNWFKRKQWKKIGETIDFKNMSYCRYAVMECVRSNGARQYKMVLMATGRLLSDIQITPHTEDPLKEINDILNS